MDTTRSTDTPLSTFSLGGIHPPEYKDQSASLAITPLAIPDEVVIPLNQHLGAPCQPTVKKGDTVKTGQVIATSDRPVSALIHSSVTGKVKAIGDAPHPSGPILPAITITAQPQDEWDDGIDPLREYDDPPWDLDRQELLVRIKSAGLVGMGGAAFPTQIKLSPPPDVTIDTVIFNGAECEPFLTADHRLMVEQPQQVVAGARLVMQALGVNQGIIGIENNKPDAISAMQSAVSNVEGLAVRVCVTQYPQGGEKQLIKAITGREVPSRKLPMHVGVVVHNVGTCAAIYEAVAKRRPLIDRVVTVSGPAVPNPANYLVRIGTRFAEVLAQSGCHPVSGSKVVNGGPMMGRAVWNLDAPVIKGTSGILVFAPGQFADAQERPCIRCGKCVEACPMGLMPVSLASKTKAGIYSDLSDYGIYDCMECGSCAYVCGSNRDLVLWFRLGKLEASKLEKQS